MTYYITFMTELKKKHARIYDPREVNDYQPFHVVDPSLVAAMPPSAALTIVNPLKVRNAATQYPRDGAVVTV